MSHSSLNTKVEYSDKHESNVAAKMANMWEQRIGSGKVHSDTGSVSSPNSVVKSSVSEGTRGTDIAKQTSRKQFSRTNTEEIVKNFERMASLHKQESKKNFSPVVRKASSVRSNGKSVDSVSKKNVEEIIDRIRSRMSDVERDLRELKSMVSDL